MTTNTIKKDISDLTTLTEAEKQFFYDALWTWISVDDHTFDLFKFLRKESNPKTGSIPFKNRNMLDNMFQLYKDYVDDMMPNESEEMEEQRIEEDREYEAFKKTQPDYIYTQVLNHKYEIDHIKKSIHIYDEATMKEFLECTGITEDSCVSIQGTVTNPQFIKDIQVYFSDNKGNVIEASQYPLGNLVDNPYSFDHFRFVFEDIEEEEQIQDEVTFKVEFVDGEEFTFTMNISEFYDANKQLKKYWNNNANN